MSITIEAVYEGGIFRPVHRVELPEHEQVQLTVDAPDVVERRRRRRLILDPEVARAIAEDPELGRYA